MNLLPCSSPLNHCFYIIGMQHSASAAVVLQNIASHVAMGMVKRLILKYLLEFHNKYWMRPDPL